jgi:hypothetical protein
MIPVAPLTPVTLNGVLQVIALGNRSYFSEYLNIVLRFVKEMDKKL